MNETLRSIHRRHSVRMLTDRPVGDEDLNVILDAANRAPSAHNQQSWRFIILRQQKKQQLAELVSGRAGDFPRPSSILLLLAATSLGIGSVWLGILFLMKRDVLDFLGEPAGEFMAVVPLGYPAKTTEGPKKRPLETLIRYLG